MIYIIVVFILSKMNRIHTNEYKNPSKIIGIQFSMLSPEEIRKNSVVEITSRETTGKLSIGGLFDAKMGVLERGLFCPTDGLTCLDTPGYFGHMEMAMPVYFIQHIKEIVKITKLICTARSALELDGDCPTADTSGTARTGTP